MVLDRLDVCSIRLWPGRDDDGLTSRQSTAVDLMQQGVALIGKPVALMTKEDKIQVVRYLNDAGAFLITKSGDKVANLLNISKFTLYSYMDAGK